MTIDKDGGMVEGHWHYKYMTIGKLKSLLNNLPDDAEIAPNRVGNLNVFIGNEKDGFDWNGYIDFTEEDYEFISE